MQINTFIESLKFRQDIRNSGIGTIQNYYMTFFPGKYGYSVVPYFTLPLNEPITPILLEALQKLLDPFDIVVKNENDVLILIVVRSLPSLKSDFVGILPQALEKAAGVLSEQGFSQPHDCIRCHEPAPDLYYYAHGVHRPVHKKCLEPDELEYLHPNQQPPPITDVESQVKSIVFSLVLMIVFAIPAFVAAVFLPFLHYFLPVLIPLGGVLGIKWGRGNVTRGTFGLLNAGSYGLAVLLVFWRGNLSALAEGSTFFPYYTTIETIIPLGIDLLVLALIVTLGMFLFRKILPIRKL